MKAILFAAVLVVLFLAAISLNRGIAEEFEWRQGLNDAFQKAADSGKLIIVLVSESISDSEMKVVAEKLASEENKLIASVFVGIKMTGKEAAEMKNRYMLKKLPAVVIVEASGKIVDAFYDESLKDIVSSLTTMIAQSLPAPDPLQLVGLMQKAADGLRSKPDASVLFTQQRILKGLDALIELARPKRVRDNNPNAMRGVDTSGNNQRNNEEGANGSGTGGGGSRDGSQPGNVDPGNADVSSAQWGKLPPKLREDASGAGGEEIPPSYRELVEEYFRSLMEK